MVLLSRLPIYIVSTSEDFTARSKGEVPRFPFRGKGANAPRDLPQVFLTFLYLFLYFNYKGGYHTISHTTRPDYNMHFVFETQNEDFFFPKKLRLHRAGTEPVIKLTHPPCPP